MRLHEVFVRFFYVRTLFSIWIDVEFATEFGFGAKMDAEFHNAGENAKRVKLTNSDSISQGPADSPFPD